MASGGKGKRAAKEGPSRAQRREEARQAEKARKQAEKAANGPC